MDDVPRESQPKSIPPGFTLRPDLNPGLDGAGQDQDGDAADDPYSPGPEALPLLLGSLIALMTVIVPLTTVVTGRSFSHHPPRFDRSGPSDGLPGAWAAQPGGGNPRRQPQ